MQPFRGTFLPMAAMGWVGLTALGVWFVSTQVLLYRMVQQVKGHEEEPRWIPPPEAPQPAISDALVVKMIERMLDVSLPATATPTTEIESALHDAEYEEPTDDWVGAHDWTDPFLGIERPLVGRLRPGESIPGVTQDGNEQALDSWRQKGEGAFGEWAADTYAPEADVAPVSWVAPIDLGDGQGPVE